MGLQDNESSTYTEKNDSAIKRHSSGNNQYRYLCKEVSSQPQPLIKDKHEEHDEKLSISHFKSVAFSPCEENSLRHEFMHFSLITLRKDISSHMLQICID